MPPLTKHLVAIALLLTTTSTLAQSVRVTVAGVCGSGSIAGSDTQQAYILTNAHVAGTTLGREVNIDYDQDGQRLRATARIVAAAYSSRTMTDWAILACPALQGKPKWPLSKTPPIDNRHFTCGSPRCVWPQVCSTVTTRSIDNKIGLWQWQPVSIGGQSGSSVRSQNAVTKGLLTWSMNGNGAGQTTAQIYAQLRDRNTIADERPRGLQEVMQLGTRSTTDDGFFAEAATGFPIWEGEDPIDPPPPDDEQKAIETLKLQAKNNSIDFTALLKLLIEFFKLIDDRKQPL